MKKVILLSMMCVFALFVNAQASGGQIRRQSTNRSVVQKQTEPRAKTKPSSSSHNVVNISEPDGYINGHGYVDLGLPSGTKWATCNIGANSPEQYGDYFAWGETRGYNSGKTNFSWKTYKWCNGSPTSLVKYNYRSGSGIVELNLEDDVAYVNYGSGWCMPSPDQFEELINSFYTTTTWTTLNGVYGRKITSKKNGNTLFLPAAGSRSDSSLNGDGSRGCYWLRTLYSASPYYASLFTFSSDNIGVDYNNRYDGRSIRPVCITK